MSERLKSALKKTCVGATLVSVSAGVAWASCGGTEALVTSAAGAMAATLTASVAAAGATLIAQDTIETRYIISSIAALTKQVKVSADEQDAQMLQAEQAGASVATDIANKELIDKTIEDYTSQGYDPCKQLTATKQFALAEIAARRTIASRVATEVQAGGGKYASPGDVLVQRDKVHKALFCTQADVDAGICTSVGAIPGGDTNASLIFSTDTSANVVTAKNAVINNIIGLPDAPIPSGQAGTATGAAYVLQKKQRDAYLAFPAYSLKAAQADAEGFDAFMRERVGQYFGTKEAENWARDQASQSERGVLVDMVKIQGLTLKVAERQLRQDLRREANEAVELALENDRINGKKTRDAAAKALAAQSAGLVTQ